MNVFIVNNNYHIQSVESRIRCGDLVIAVPHNIDIEALDAFRVQIIPSFFKGRRWIASVFSGLALKLQVKFRLKPLVKPGGTVYFFTEYDPTNGEIVRYLKCMYGYKCVLLPDGGIATYFSNSVEARSEYVRHRLKQILINIALPRLGFAIYRCGHQVIYRISDKLIDEMHYSYLVPSQRDVRVQVVKDRCKINQLSVLPDEAIFYTQPVYESFCSEADYISLLIKVFSENKNIKYIKFHPRDHGRVKVRVMQAIADADSVTQEVKEVHRGIPGIGQASLFSAALLERLELGDPIVFLHKYMEIFDPAYFRQIAVVLAGILEMEETHGKWIRSESSL